MEPRVRPGFAHSPHLYPDDLLAVERATALRLRDEAHINDEVLRQLEYELDLTETKLSRG